MVTVDDITHYLIPKGYTLAVTLEIGDATLGGLAMGVGMTTHSHKVGLYQETVLSYDMILSDGSLVHATCDNEHSDLYYTLPWSHGTLGFLVALELQIIPVKPYVHMKYTHVHGQKNYCDQIRSLSGANDKHTQVADYLEATVFSKDEAVIMEGRFTEIASHPKTKINYISGWYKPWYYKHVETYLDTGGGEELIPLRDYLLRHNRAIFWVVESMIPFGNHPLFRLLFGWLLPPKPAFLKFSTTPGVRIMTFAKQVFQDIVLPLKHLEETIDKSDELFDGHPLLIYPCRVYRRHGNGQVRDPHEDTLVPDTDYAMYHDLGVYGVPGPVRRKERFDSVAAMRAMEKYTRDIGGCSFLYADIFMSRQEFEEMFDLTSYERVRKKYKADAAFPHLFDKVKPEIDVCELGKKNMDPL